MKNKLDLTTFGTNNIHKKFAEICSEECNKYVRKKYIAKLNKFNKLLSSVSENEHYIFFGKFLVEHFKNENDTSKIGTHFNNLIVANYRNNLNKK